MEQVNAQHRQDVEQLRGELEQAMQQAIVTALEAELCELGSNHAENPVHEDEARKRENALKVDLEDMSSMVEALRSENSALQEEVEEIRHTAEEDWTTLKGLVDTANAKAASEKEQSEITIRDLQGQALTLQSQLVIEREAADQKVAVEEAQSAVVLGSLEAEKARHRAAIELLAGQMEGLKARVGDLEDQLKVCVRKEKQARLGLKSAMSAMKEQTVECKEHRARIGMLEELLAAHGEPQSF